MRTHIVNGEIQHFFYDSQHKLTEITFKNSRRYAKVTYDYDALGRRIRKTSHKINAASAPQTTHFHWQGMKLVGEHRDADAPDYYFYAEGSYTPIARVHCTKNQQEIYYYHAEQNGLPVMLTDSAGFCVY